MQALARHSESISVPATLMATCCIGVILLCMRFLRRVPDYIVVLFLATIAATLLHMPLETIGTRFNGNPSGLPAFRFPDLQVDKFFTLLSPALTVALLGALESLISAVVSDRRERR
jgi:sulfate permease, SulP family